MSTEFIKVCIYIFQGCLFAYALYGTYREVFLKENIVTDEASNRHKEVN